MDRLVGRKYERDILNGALESPRSELIVVYGRRRIGKTFLIKEAYKGRMRFDFSGMYQAPLKRQLRNFHQRLSEYGHMCDVPEDWVQAFHFLSQYLSAIRSKKKKVIFLDEFPWLDTHRSGFLSAFDYFWNTFASTRDDLVVVICGSAASYMINKIILNKGGLHNRITERIHLKPFSLAETEKLLRANGLRYTHYDIAQFYMVMGGIPYYLQKIKAGESVEQLVDRLCFQKDGFLRTEFSIVFASLFQNSDRHESIVRTLARKRKGMTRKEILQHSKLSSGGRFSKTLQELEESGFVERMTPMFTKTDPFYRLSDEYSMFYLSFIEKTQLGEQVWQKLSKSPKYKAWSGYAFESICQKHIPQVKKRLGIAGTLTTQHSWSGRIDDQGAQIDLVLDRDDNVINICEVKFFNSEFNISKKYASELRRKIEIFKLKTKTRKSVFVTCISVYGLKSNMYSREIFQSEVLLKDLFA